MIDFDWNLIGEIEIPLNPADELFNINKQLFGNHYEDDCVDIETKAKLDVERIMFKRYSSAYLHAADVILQESYDVLSDSQRKMDDYSLYLGVVAFRLYIHSIEVMMKQLLLDAGLEIRGHNLHKLNEVILKHYSYCNPFNDEYKLDWFVAFIENTNKMTCGSETGRYPTDKNGYFLLHQKNGAVVYITLTSFARCVHRLYTDYFPHLIKRGVANENNKS